MDYKKEIEKAELLFMDGQIEKAEVIFKKILHEDPGNYEVANNLGVIENRRGEYHASEQYFLKSLSIKDDYPDALLNLATLYQDAKRWEEAALQLEKCIAIDDQDPNLYNQLGMIYLELGDTQKSFAVLQKSIELNPDQEIVRKSLEAIVKKLKPLSESREIIRNENISNYRSILIVMDQGIGNMVMLTPTLKALKAHLPEAEITVLGKKPALEVLEGLGVRALTEPEDNNAYDIGFYSVWSASFERLFGPKLEQQCGGIFYRAVNDNPDLHEVEHHMKFARFLGFSDPTPQPYCGAKELKVPWDDNERVVALSDTTFDHPAWQRKRWPYFKELAWELKKRGYKIALVGGPSEADKFNPDGWPEVYNFLGKHDIPETSGVLKKCSLFIGNDSGPMHIAAALDIPTIVFFGPTLMSKNLPTGPLVKAIHPNLDCSPCQYTERWARCSDWRCMTEMTIERVVPLILGAGKFLVQTEKPTKLVPMRSEERFRWVRQSIMPKKKQPKILIYYHHGLGDIIQLTPHLRFFYQQGCKVDLMCTNDVVQSHLLDACPYINQLIVVENPWRSGLKNYVKTIQKNIEGMDQLLGYDKRLIVDHLGTFYNVPKLDYTSYQLGILRDLQDKRGEVFIPEMIEEEVQEYCDKHFPKGFIFNHTAIELNPHNSWDSSAWIKDNLPDLPIVNTGAGGSHFKIHEDINFTFVLIKRANHVVVSDSVMLWACFAMNKPIDIAYYGRPDLRSLPLDKHLVQRLVWNAEILQGAEKDRIFDSRKIMKIN